MNVRSCGLMHFWNALSIYEASLSGHFIPAFIAAAALGLVLTKFLNSSDYSSFDFPFYNESFLIEVLVIRGAAAAI
jgi:hypothetical protein